MSSKTRASIPLDAIRRARDTPIWKLEAALKCRSRETGRCAPPGHIIKLTQEREIIIRAAGLRDELTFTSFGRHGGATET